MARLTGCCCCFGNLRDGSRAIGITLLVLSTLGLISMIFHATMGPDRSGPVEEEDLRGDSADSAMLTVTKVFFGLLSMVFHCLLVRGVEIKSRGRIKAWLIYFGISQGINSVVMAALFIYACMLGPWWLAMLVLALVALIGVFWYWFVVVLHYFKELKEEDGFVYSRQQPEEGEKHAL